MSDKTPYEQMLDALNKKGEGIKRPWEHILKALEGLEGATDEQVEASVKKYLDENPVRPTPVDDTLTQPTYAADAKVVGDAIAELKAEGFGIDTTLTKAKKAAEAKAVGERFAEFDGKYAKQTDIHTLQTQINTNKTNISTNKSNIAQNKIDITELKTDVDTIETDLQTEITIRKKADIGLQEQIDKLSAKTQILGATNCPEGQEQTVLTAYAKSVTSDSTRPAEGDAINIIEDGSGNARQEQWQWIVIKNASGAITSQSWKKMTGPPTVTKATTNALGVAMFPEDGGLSIDSDGKVTTNKTLIGLGNVDNVRQYSKDNPAPVKVILDNETFTGDTKNGVAVSIGAIRFDKAQSLTETQKARARVNLGIVDDGTDSEQVIKNKNDIALIKNDINNLNMDVEELDGMIKELDADRQKVEADLQDQIDALEAKGEWIGSIATIGGDLTKLTAFVKSEKSREPISGDIVSVVDEDAQYRYNGSEWALYLSTAQKDASKTAKGVVTVGDGINVDGGKISTDKDAIGLDKVDNVKQYSEENPVPIKLTLDGVDYEGDSKDGVTGTTTNLKYTSQILTAEQQEQARANIGALGVFQSETERDTFKAQVETNKEDISTIKDEQVVQNTEIANLKKKSQWIGSIENPEDAEITDAMLNAAILEKVGTSPKEGYQLSVFASDGNSTVYQYSETSNTWAISSKNADLQIASTEQVGLIQIGTGLKADEDGKTDVDITVIATRAYVDAHSGGGSSAQGDWTETDPTSSSYIKNKPFGNVPPANIETDEDVLIAEDGCSFEDANKKYYWIGDEFVSKASFKENIDSLKYFASNNREVELSGGVTFLNAIDSNKDRYMVDIGDVSFYFAVVDADEKDASGNVTLYRGIYVALTSKGYFLCKIYSSAKAKRLLSDEMLDAIYPVGSVYLSMNNVNPSTFFGGTWKQAGEGHMLVGVGKGKDANSVEKEFAVGVNAGEYAHTQTEKEMFSHQHLFNQHDKDGAQIIYSYRKYRVYNHETSAYQSASDTGASSTHQHKIRVKGTKKSGTDTAGIMSFSEQKDNATFYSWTSTSSGKATPSYAHGDSSSSSQAYSDGRHYHAFKLTGGTNYTVGNYTRTDGKAVEESDLRSKKNNDAMNTTNPSFGVYIWQRTA